MLTPIKRGIICAFPYFNTCNLHFCHLKTVIFPKRKNSLPKVQQHSDWGFVKKLSSLKISENFLIQVCWNAQKLRPHSLWLPLKFLSNQDSCKFIKILKKSLLPLSFLNLLFFQFLASKTLIFFWRVHLINITTLLVAKIKEKTRDEKHCPKIFYC